MVLSKRVNYKAGNEDQLVQPALNRVRLDCCFSFLYVPVPNAAWPVVYSLIGR